MRPRGRLSWIRWGLWRRIYPTSFGGSDREDDDDDDHGGGGGDEGCRLRDELEELESRKGNVSREGLRYERQGFYSSVSVLAWTAFWELADQNQDNWRSVLLTWVCVGAAMWVAINF